MGGLTPLLYATRQGHFDAVRTLLESGVDINQLSADKTTPLMMPDEGFDAMLLAQGAKYVPPGA